MSACCHSGALRGAVLGVDSVPETHDGGEMPNLKLTVQYVGTAYFGWQIQPGRPTIQGHLKEALRVLLREDVMPHGAARTDAGVHALGQVANAPYQGASDPRRLLRGLNALLPPDIRVSRVEPVGDDFHARHSARGRSYRYRIHHGEVCSPFERQLTAWVRAPLDAAAMKRAAALLVGRHDFAAFRGAGDQSRSPLKTIRRSEIAEEDSMIIYTVEADSFLQYMVRNISGTLIEVGRGRIAPESVSDILGSRDRRLAGPTAPPSGLFLVEVLYGDLVPPSGG